jgi:hypothetical protein
MGVTHHPVKEPVSHGEIQFGYIHVIGYTIGMPAFWNPDEGGVLIVGSPSRDV